ncbi:MAG TPA: RNA-binding protein [Terriglobia bacterium]|nr:RNA-binding protein [Terriglobia bacterium]
MNKRLYVGNLPYKIDEASLQALFSQAGAVESVHVMREPETGRARGFAFVEMVTEQDATNAINQFHEYQLDGRALTVNEARPKAQRAGRW